MTSNPPSQPAPEWPASGPVSEPLDALPAAEDGFGASAERFHTGPQDRFHTGPQPRLPTGPQERVQAAPGRWPTIRSPWPGPAMAQAAPDPAAEANGPGPATGEQPKAAAPEPERPAAASRVYFADPGDERLATLSYVGVPFLGPLVPLAVYLFRRNASSYVRRHSAQALNLSITTLLYTVCALILGAMLALDSIVVALIVVVPIAVALWLTMLAYVIVAGSRANRGEYFAIPGWLCAVLVH
jgi:uncharacterized Tic20 family protein